MEVQSNLKKIQELYKEYKINKKNIDNNWISFFDDLTEEAADLLEGNSNHVISKKAKVLIIIHKIMSILLIP